MDRTQRLRQYLDIIENKQVQSDKPFISIVTIYDEINEAQYLADFVRALPRVKEGVFELILCKCVPATGHKPKPKAPGNINGITVHYVAFPYQSWSFADARNVAATAASGEWILSLDTDEILAESQAIELEKLCRNSPKNIGAYSLKIYSQVCDDSRFEAVPVTRLYRNDERLKYQCAVHETVMFSMQETELIYSESELSLFHSGYAQSRDVLISKLERNLQMITAEYARYKHSHIKEYMKVHLFNTVFELQRFYENREKDRDRERTTSADGGAADYLSHIAARLAD